MNAADEKLARIQAAQRRKLIRRWALAVAILAFVLLLGGLLYIGTKTPNIQGVTSYREVGRGHIDLKAPPSKPYNSNPPSSGDHYSVPANWGIYDIQVPDTVALHNMEHGGVWITYRPGVSADVVSQLVAIAREFNGSKILMNPRAENDADIALAAWAKVSKFDLDQGKLSESQEDSVRDFYKAFVNRGPEFVPDGMFGLDPRTIQ